MRENPLRHKLASGDTVLSGWVTVGDPLVAETMAHAGFDAVTLDLQHGALDAGELLRALQALSATDAVPLVRVPWNEPWAVMKALDLGAYGVICPMIESRGDAERFVRACRYPPAGQRSYGPTRAALYAGEGYARHANDTVLAIGMIETRGALDDLDEILAVPGLDLAFVGPADLAQALGEAPGAGPAHPAVSSALGEILAACERHGIPAGIFTKSVEDARAMRERGFRFVTAGSDMNYLARGAADVVERLRDA